MPRIRTRRRGATVAQEGRYEEVLTTALSGRGHDPKVDEQIHMRRLQEEREAARMRHVQLARADVNEFCAFVGRDAITGHLIDQEPLHEEFQRHADEHDRLIEMAHPESGKTTQLSILRVLYLLGHNPNLRVAIVSKTGGTASKSARAIRSYIAKSKELAEVFPDMIPGDKWEEDFFTVRRSSHSGDPSVQALGLDCAVIGSRIDVLIFDDVLDHENTSSEDKRKKTLSRIRAGFLDRLTRDGVVMLLTNAWHPGDAAHVLEKEGWRCYRRPVIDDEGRPSWPSKWPMRSIEKARKDMGPLEFARAHLCKAREEGESPFDEDAIERCTELSADLELVHKLLTSTLPPGAWIYTGVDLAVSKSKGSHLTALVTLLHWPEADGTLCRQVLWVESGRWSSREIRDKVLDHDRRYQPTFIVENVAAQRWIIDIILNQADLPEEERRLPEIVPFTTGKNKAHPVFGVEGIAVEVANGQWRYPEIGPAKAVYEVEELKAEKLYYVRGAHTGDRLMAAWFAREGCRRGARAGDREEVEEKNVDPWDGTVPGAGAMTPAERAIHIVPAT